MKGQTIFLIGATGETGRHLLEGLLKDASFDITCLVRPESAAKPAVQKLKDRGVKVVTGDLSEPHERLVALLRGIDTVISIVKANSILKQLPFVDAAVEAGVKRFVPCDWSTPIPRGGVMTIRDQKELVYDHILRQGLGYTIINVGYWYTLSFLRLPSGRFDYASILPTSQVFVDGTTPNMLVDARDLGPITARIIKDEQTLNKKVYFYGEVLAQNDIAAIIEKQTGEKPETVVVSAKEMHTALEKARNAYEADPSRVNNLYALSHLEHSVSRFIRADNTPDKAEYLGYMNARELYPDVKFISFAEFVDDLAAGRIEHPYPELQLDL